MCHIVNALKLIARQPTKIAPSVSTSRHGGRKAWPSRRRRYRRRAALRGICRCVGFSFSTADRGRVHARRNPRLSDWNRSSAAPPFLFVDIRTTHGAAGRELTTRVTLWKPTNAAAESDARTKNYLVRVRHEMIGRPFVWRGFDGVSSATCITGHQSNTCTPNFADLDDSVDREMRSVERHEFAHL